MQELQRAVNVLYQMSIMAEFNSSLMEKQGSLLVPPYYSVLCRYFSTLVL